MFEEIFVNLPVKDLNKSIKFFKELGFSFNHQFTDENVGCMIIGYNIFLIFIKTILIKSPKYILGLLKSTFSNIINNIKINPESRDIPKFTRLLDLFGSIKRK